LGVSIPKIKRQNDSPNDSPYSPSDVGVFRLPFQDSFVKGHDKYPSLLFESPHRGIDSKRRQRQPSVFSQRPPSLGPQRPPMDPKD
jgi:hypothetical protein